MRQVICKNCGRHLCEEHRACPDCGGTARVYHLRLCDTIKLTDGFTWRQKRPGRKGPSGRSRPTVAEGFTRFERSKTGLEVKHTRVIDRESDLYFQRVENVGTGKILHPHCEALSQKDPKAKHDEANGVYPWGKGESSALIPAYSQQREELLYV